MISRRGFLAGSVTLLAAPLAAEAQQAGKVYRIAWLAPAANPDNLDAFRNGLRALGYLEGTNILMDTRYAERSAAQLFDVALELVRRDLDLIVTDGSSAASALKRTGSAIPVVFVSGDPVGMGLVPRLSRPGGTMTGFGLVSTELSVKRLQLVREAFPGRSRLGVFYEKRQLGHMIPPMEAAARSLSLQLKRLEVNGAADIDEAFAAAVRENVAVVMLLASALFQAERHRLVELAAKHRLPTIYENRAFSEAGGLMSYGPDLRDVFRRAATHVDKILKGAKPSELPVEQPTKFELVINLKTAKALGLTIPPSLLSRADQVIE